ncbi:hypothetical protein SVAN01_07422 [Stagonosporopsis vannaccii]|nr:hypothetical protein SVAN01_07422 [Stagonosporopsis vannaccii]
MPTLLSIPRELREEIIHHLTLPATIYTSSAQADTYSLYQSGSRKLEETYVDTRIFLPSRPPTNLLSTCKQLRQECLEHHAHRLNSSAAAKIKDSEVEAANSTKVAERSGTEFDESAERTADDGVTLRVTLEVERGQRGPFGGYYVPIREELSPRLLALLPLIHTARKLKIVVWPGFDWWNGPPQASPLGQWRQRKALLKRINAYQVGHTEQPVHTEAAKMNESVQPKLDGVSVAVRKLLDRLPSVEELDLSVFIATGDLFRWDLPDVKWEKIQPWLDSPITRSRDMQLQKVSRSLTSVWQRPETEIASHQPFYVQKEERSEVSSNTWRVKRLAGWRAPMFEHLAHLAALELPEISVNETFERIDS